MNVPSTHQENNDLAEQEVEPANEFENFDPMNSGSITRPNNDFEGEEALGDEEEQNDNYSNHDPMNLFSSSVPQEQNNDSTNQAEREMISSPAGRGTDPLYDVFSSSSQQKQTQPDVTMPGIPALERDGNNGSSMFQEHNEEGSP